MSDAPPIVSTTALAGFASVALAMVVTPGPNMAYLVSRTIYQGRAGRR
jgi:threonine/homoserine/homoserine lactone efflux protein